LTPNFKLKRYAARKAFEQDIKDLYNAEPFKTIPKKVQPE